MKYGCIASLSSTRTIEWIKCSIAVVEAAGLLRLEVCRTQLVVLLDAPVAFPGVCEPDVWCVDGGEVFDV